MQHQVLAGRVGGMVGSRADDAVLANGTGRGDLVGTPVGVQQFGEQADVVIQGQVTENAGAEPLDGIDRVEHLV